MRSMLILATVLLCGCSSQVSKNTNYTEVSPEAMILLSLTISDNNRGIGDLAGFDFVKYEYQDNSDLVKLDRWKVIKLRQSATLTGPLRKYLSEKKFFLLKGVPGTYALKSVLNNKSGMNGQNINVLCRLPKSFTFKIKAGEISYIGDYALSSYRYSYQNIVPLGKSAEDAQEYLSTAPNISAPFVNVKTSDIAFDGDCKSELIKLSGSN